MQSNEITNPNPNSTVNTIALQPDGSILLGGAFTTVWGTARNRVARVTSAGALDATFNPNANNTVNTLALQSDGSVILWWAFTTMWWVARNYLTRVSSIWVLDTGFNPNPNAAVSSSYILGNGSIIAWWAFTTVWGISRTELVKISPQWVVDDNLDVPFLAAATTINTIALDNENNLLVWGTFTIVDGNANTPYFAQIGVSEYMDMNQAMFWADASVGTNCTTTGCAISTWREKAFSRIGTQVTATNQPIYQTAGTNFNPTVQFAWTPIAVGSAAFDYLTYGVQSLNITNKMTVFVVQNLHTAGEHYPIWLQNGATQWRYSNLKLQANKWTSASAGGLIAAPYISSVAVNDSLATHYVNGGRVASSNLTTGAFVTGNALWVWGTEAVGNYSVDGDIAEIIVYNRALTWVIRNQVESYLALKYGTTLNQTIDGDWDTIAWTSYRNGLGEIVWDAAAHLWYNNNIIWLWRDSRTSLQQRISRSAATWDNIILATIDDFVSPNQASYRTNPNDESYFVMWHNNGSTWFDASYDGGINNRISRIWKAQTTNYTSGVYIAIQSGALWLPVGMSTGSAIVVSSDTIFTSADTVVPLSTTGIYLYANATIPNWSYITFVNQNLGSLTIDAPTTLNIWTTQAQGIAQILSWQSTDFTVSDWQGTTSGYYTTISVSDLTSSVWTIVNTTMSIKADPIITIAWAGNPAVVLDAGITSYVPASGTLVFMERNIGTWPWIVWTYGSKIRLQVPIPAYTPVANYTGTITYTLIEN